MANRKKSLWIRGAVRRRGALSRQLGIPERENIPVSLLRAIVRAEIGDIVQNPTQRGKRWYKVTTLLKRRAVLALNLRRLKKR